MSGHTTEQGTSNGASTSANNRKWNSELGIWEGSAAAAPEDFKLPPGPVWVFGYGSLTWKPSFAFEEMRRGILRGFARLFWQQSMDHRGTPATPGAVVTLVTKSDLEKQSETLKSELIGLHREKGADIDSVLTVHGVAFRLPAAKEETQKILDDLDFREKGGYSRSIQTVEFDNGESVEALVYAGTAENPNFRPLGVDDTAAVIASAVGPSGPNIEYLFKLESFLDEDRTSHDEYVEALAAKVREQLPTSTKAENAGTIQTASAVETSLLLSPSSKLKGCFVGSGSDGLQQPEVVSAVMSLVGKKPADSNVLYIGTPTYDLSGWVMIMTPATTVRDSAMLQLEAVS